MRAAQQQMFEQPSSAERIHQLATVGIETRCTCKEAAKDPSDDAKARRPTHQREAGTEGLARFRQKGRSSPNPGASLG